MSSARAVVLGIGNILLSDEGVGVRAIEALRDAYAVPAELDVIDGGTSAMELLDDLSRAKLLIVVDAVKAGRPPASIVHLSGDEVPVFFRTKLSPHQIGLSDVLASLELLGEAPEETIIIGVQPVTLSLGMSLSGDVAAILPDVLQMLVADLRNHGIVLHPRTAIAA
ncbi:MAG: HyaD/HybD family hydrogenase maturation endopeptidase [Proteobacteria bacterium]|nr:HyaD/HybD family hydrogenase maturation endopeptidase [Pseudomonadota bacterium]